MLFQSGQYIAQQKDKRRAAVLPGALKDSVHAHQACWSKTLEKFKVYKSLLIEPKSESSSRSHGMDRVRTLRLLCITNPLLCCRHHRCYLSSSGVLLVEIHKSHFCMELTLSSSGGWRAESALLGFAPVVPGCLGISNLRLRPLIILLSKLPNIWVCKIGLEISHKHAFPSGISAFICQWSPGLQMGTEDSAWKPKV